MPVDVLQEFIVLKRQEIDGMPINCHSTWKISFPWTKRLQLLYLATTSMSRDLVFLPTLLWRHNGSDGVSNHHCLHNHSFRRRSQKTPKLRVTGFYAGNSPVTSEFHAQMASYAEKVSIWWRHHVVIFYHYCDVTGLAWGFIGRFDQKFI